MNLLQALKMALKSLRSNKIRSFLTMLGIIIGIWAFIMSMGIGMGTQKSVEESIKSMGVNLITINILGRDSNRKVDYDELTKFVENNENTIEGIAPMIRGQVTVKFEDKNKTVALEGTTWEYEWVRNNYIQDGRFLMPFDTEFRQKVLVMGTAVAKTLFPWGSPVGEDIKVNGVIFKVVGLLEEKTSSEDGTDDDKIIIPVTVAQRLLKNSAIRNYYVQAKTSNTVEDARLRLQEFLLKTYQNPSAFRVNSQSDMLATASDITGKMTAMLGTIAIVSLIVGGIGVMNIMLVSVTERTREIGIRKAIGAKRKNILMQFLIEAVILSCTGGLIGILAGIVIANASGKLPLVNVQAVISIPAVMISFSFSLLIGIFFGLYPANKASKLNPIEALRYE